MLAWSDVVLPMYMALLTRAFVPPVSLGWHGNFLDNLFHSIHLHTLPLAWFEAPTKIRPFALITLHGLKRLPKFAHPCTLHSLPLRSL